MLDTMSSSITAQLLAQTNKQTHRKPTEENQREIPPQNKSLNCVRLLKQTAWKHCTAQLGEECNKMSWYLKEAAVMEHVVSGESRCPAAGFSSRGRLLAPCKAPAQWGLACSCCFLPACLQSLTASCCSPGSCCVPGVALALWPHHFQNLSPSCPGCVFPALFSLYIPSLLSLEHDCGWTALNPPCYVQHVTAPQPPHPLPRRMPSLWRAKPVRTLWKPGWTLHKFHYLNSNVLYWVAYIIIHYFSENLVSKAKALISKVLYRI